MAQMKTAPRAAPVVQMLMGLRQPQPAKQAPGRRATLEDFEREQMGVAAKE